MCYGYAEESTTRKLFLCDLTLFFACVRGITDDWESNKNGSTFAVNY